MVGHRIFDTKTKKYYTSNLSGNSIGKIWEKESDCDKMMDKLERPYPGRFEKELVCVEKVKK